MRRLIAIGCNNYLYLNSILENRHQHDSPQSEVQLEATSKISIQRDYLYRKIICTRETHVLYMNIRCMYNKFTNTWCRMTRNIMHYGGDRFKVEQS